MEEQNRQQRIHLLAQEILEMGRTKLLLRMNFLDQALYQMKPKESEKDFFATDGDYFYYPPRQVLALYRENQDQTLRMWLHPLMHCLFVHMFVDSSVNQELWDLSCDMAAEAMIEHLGFYDRIDPLDKMRKKVLKEVKEKTDSLNAEKIYRLFLDDAAATEVLHSWQQLFAFDSHTVWYARQEQTDISRRSARKKKEATTAKKEEAQGGAGEAPKDSSRRWKHLSRQMESELLTFSRQKGEKSGQFLKALSKLHRKPCDYRTFLRKFASLSEVVRTSPDEFDYIFYSYGMELYKDMPLIEPLEYCEDKKIRDFVIVLDTSGSVQGEMVRLFLEKTFAILKQHETFDRQFRLHIIQCDSEVKRDDVICTQVEFDQYMERIQLHGFGGTDFRPAFEYVEQLRKNHAFHRLKGMLYFTDGIGKYPAKCPDYRTAFVFVNRESMDYAQVPPWAMQVLLEKDDLTIIREERK